MPVHVAAQAFFEGVGSVPFLVPILKLLPWIAGLLVVKLYFSGASNLSERKLNGKVVIVTGGTSGVGEAIVRSLATRGAQVVLLTQHPLSDPFIVEYIEDVRRATRNHLITAEQVDLSSLYSIRTFATKWVDNVPPRRLDMIVLCANTMNPGRSTLRSAHEEVELTWQVNYLANFHLLSILSPALRAQPPDRDVRVIVGSCSSYMGGDLLQITQGSKTKSPKDAVGASGGLRAPTEFSPGNAYATSKLALVTFALAFQRRLTTYQRPDKAPMNTKLLLVDPGYCRTPGTRRWLSSGTLVGLFVYLLTYPIWWVLLKSPNMGAQSFLFASMDEKFSRGGGGWLIKECKEREFLRTDVEDTDTQESLWEYSVRMVAEAEKRGVVGRANRKQSASANAQVEVRHEQPHGGDKQRQGKHRNRKQGDRKM